MRSWQPSVLPFSVLEHGAFVFAGLLIYVLVTRIGRQRRHPSAAIGWVLLILLMPYAGVPLFLAFGTRKFTRPARAGPSPSAIGTGRDGAGDTAAGGDAGGAGAGGVGSAADDFDRASWAIRLAAAMGLAGPTRNASALFLDGGETALRDQMQGIGEARSSIALCTYVLGDDPVGHALIDALVAGAARGVRVRLLLDAVGSLKMPARRLGELRRSGVEVRRFMPLLHNPLRGRTNLRNHRKLLVVDGRRVWTGGRNQAAEYFLPAADGTIWHDLSFRVDGPLAASALDVFEHDWSIASGFRVRHRVDASAEEQRTASSAGPVSSDEPAAAGGRACARGADAGAGIGARPVPAQLVPSGPDHADDTMYSLLLAGAYQARRRIVAVTPYFVPDDGLLYAWGLACRRGVSLTLIVPRRSNHRLADLARERALRALSAVGAQIRLYPEMLHAKAVVVDDDVAFCGSINLDGRSLFLNYELNTAFYGAAQIDWLSAWSEELARDAQPYEAKQPSWSRDVVEGVVRSIGFQL